MTDFEAFEEAVANETNYAANLARSLSLTLDKFYSNITSVGVSAITGEGLEELIDKIRASRSEYKEMMEERAKEREAQAKLKEELKKEQAETEPSTESSLITIGTSSKSCQ